MNDWPPQPGLTVMKSNRSISRRYGSTSSTGVSGLSVSPTPTRPVPQLVEQRAGVADLDVHDAPIRTRLGEVGEQHRGVVDHEVAVEEEVGVLRSDFTTGGPMVRLGTKWPSITSTCNRSASPRHGSIVVPEPGEVGRQDRWCDLDGAGHRARRYPSSSPRGASTYMPSVPAA